MGCQIWNVGAIGLCGGSPSASLKACNEVSKEWHYEWLLCNVLKCASMMTRQWFFSDGTMRKKYSQKWFAIVITIQYHQFRIFLLSRCCKYVFVQHYNPFSVNEPIWHQGMPLLGCRPSSHGTFSVLQCMPRKNLLTRTTLTTSVQANEQGATKTLTSLPLPPVEPRDDCKMGLTLTFGYLNLHPQAKFQ